MTKKQKEILDRLAERYGSEPEVTLDYEKPFQLLIETILSEQCTDARVNIVTKELYNIPSDKAAPPGRGKASIAS